jgi:hypothetical protein
MELYAQPAEPSPNTPTEPVPSWFRQILHGPMQQFGELRDAARRYDADWGVYVDLIRYRDLDDQVDWFSVAAAAKAEPSRSRAGMSRTVFFSSQAEPWAPRLVAEPSRAVK